MDGDVKELKPGCRWPDPGELPVWQNPDGVQICKPEAFYQGGPQWHKDCQEMAGTVNGEGLQRPISVSTLSNDLDKFCLKTEKNGAPYEVCVGPSPSHNSFLFREDNPGLVLYAYRPYLEAVPGGFPQDAPTTCAPWDEAIPVGDPGKVVDKAQAVIRGYANRFKGLRKTRAAFKVELAGLHDRAPKKFKSLADMLRIYVINHSEGRRTIVDAFDRPPWNIRRTYRYEEMIRANRDSEPYYDLASGKLFFEVFYVDRGDGYYEALAAIYDRREGFDRGLPPAVFVAVEALAGTNSALTSSYSSSRLRVFADNRLIDLGGGAPVLSRYVENPAQKKSATNPENCRRERQTN